MNMIIQNSLKTSGKAGPGEIPHAESRAGNIGFLIVVGLAVGVALTIFWDELKHEPFKNAISRVDIKD